MIVRVSYDEGKTWPVSKMLSPGPAAYSCLTVLPDMMMGCLYEKEENSAYETIAFARFSLEWLTEVRDSLARKYNPDYAPNGLIATEPERRD